MDVDDDDGRFRGQGCDLLVGPPEGAVQRLHEHPALEVQDRRLDPVAVLEDVGGMAGVDGGIVGRPEEAGLPAEIWQGFLLVPDVVAGGQDVDLEEELASRSPR